MSRYVIARQTVPNVIHLHNGYTLVEDFTANVLCIHAPDCPDLVGVEATWNAEGGTLREMVDTVYGPDGGSFYAEVYEPGTPEYDNAWRDYAREFRVMPCASDLEEQP